MNDRYGSFAGPMRRPVQLDIRSNSSAANSGSMPQHYKPTPQSHDVKPKHQHLPSAAELAALTNRPLHPKRSVPSSIPKPIPQAMHKVEYKQPLFEQVIVNEKRKQQTRKSRKTQLAFVMAGFTIVIIGVVVSVLGLRTRTPEAAQMVRYNQFI